MRVVFCVAGLFRALISLAQQDLFQLDTVVINSHGLSKYATGADVQSIVIEPFSDRLDQLLSGNNSIYLKTYGNNQLSTISFRGTSASHTNVLWHDIPVNSPTLGQTDFSLWPVWLLDQVGLQPGSAGSLYGSGSIGGTVFIDNFEDRRKDENGLKASIENGSFGYNFMGLKGTYKGEKWITKTSVLRNYIENDFPYKLKGTGSKQFQNNASGLGYGVRQNLQLFLGNQRLSLDAMFTSNDRELQPSVTNQDGTDELKIRNIRTAFEYLIDTKVGSFSSTLSFQHDDYLYNNVDLTQSNQFSFLQKYDHQISQSLAILGGLLLNKTIAIADNYLSKATIEQLDIFSSLKWEAFSHWQLSMSVRKPFIKDVSVPIVPSFSSKLTLNKGRHSLKLISQIAFGYRYPTLNDRFWVPGGNPELNPESSLNLESGFSHFVSYAPNSLNWGLNIYTIKADNWIIWKPENGGIWSPENVQKVQVNGLEFNVGVKLSFLSAIYKSNLNTSYQLSTNQSEYPSKLEKGNQLPYVPFIISSWKNNLIFSKWSFGVSQHFTGKRFTTLDNSDFQSVSGYYLLDATGSYQFRIKRLTVTTGIAVRNVLNAYYENLKNRAMPGINYQLQLQINL